MSNLALAIIKNKHDKADKKKLILENLPNAKTAENGRRNIDAVAKILALFIICIKISELKILFTYTRCIV